MSDGDINLAALWVPVMAETSKIKGQLSEAGTEGAREFARNFNTETQSLIEKGFNSAMRSSFTKAGRDAFNDFQKSFQPQQGQGKFQEFGHKAGEGVLDGLRGSLLTGGVAGITAALTEAFLSGFEHLAEGATEVFDKIIEGAEEVVHKVIEVGEQFEKIEHQILEFSTASGEGFENLRLSATTVLGEIDTKGDDLGKTMAVLSQRLGLEAGPALEDLTRHVEELGDRFGRIDVEGFTGALAQLGVKGEDADGVLASWTQSAREAGITVNDIVGVMPQMGEALSQVGLNAQQSGALVSEWAQKSLPLNKVLTGFSTAEKVFAEKNMDFKSGLVETAKELQHFKDIGDQKDYQKLAETVFGPRNWTIAQAAIQQLLDVLGRAPNAFDATSGSVDDLTQHTQTLGNKWQQVQNQIKTALAPLGGAVLAGLGSALDALGNYVKTHHDQIVNWIKDLGDKFIASIPTFQKWAVDLIEIFRAVYQVFANMAAGFLETFGKMLAGTGQLLDKLPAAFKKLIPGGQDEINAMKDFGKGMLDAGKSIVDADIGGKLETLRGKIQALNPDLDTLKSKWNSTVDTMTTGQSLDALSGANINQLGAAPGGAGGGQVNLLTPPGGAGTGGFNWDAVAGAESSGRWSDNNSGNNSTSSGAPRGGLQITDGTWAAFGGKEFAPTAAQATKEQQIEVANRIAFTGWQGTPPQGLGAWQTITEGKVPGITTSSGPGGSAGSSSGSAGSSISLGPGTGSGISLGPGTGPRAWERYKALRSAQDSADEANEAVGHDQRRVDDLNKQLTQLKSQPGLLGDPDKVAKTEQDLQEATEALAKARRKQAEAAEDLQHEETTGADSSGQNGGNSAAEQFGGSFLKGLASDFGLGNVLGGKSPLDWGITKLGGGLAGWAMNTFGGGGGGGGFPGFGRSGGGGGGGLGFLQNLIPGMPKGARGLGGAGGAGFPNVAFSGGQNDISRRFREAMQRGAIGPNGELAPGTAAGCRSRIAAEHH